MEALSSPESLAPFCFIFFHSGHHYTILYYTAVFTVCISQGVYFIDCPPLTCGSAHLQEDIGAFVLLPEASSVLRAMYNTR